MSSIYFNPFALTSAKEQWSKDNQNFLKRTTNAICYSTYDIVIKNPYDLTFGNFKAFQNSSKIKKIAIASIILISTFYTAMLYGGITFSFGALISTLGHEAGVESIVISGQKIETLGEKLFLIGSIPSYISVYTLPQKIVENLPIFLNKIIKKIDFLVKSTWKNILLPLKNKTSSAIKLTVKYLDQKLTPLIKEIITVISKVLFSLKQNLIKINNSIIKFHKHIINTLKPIINKIGEAIALPFKLIVKHFVEIVKDIAKFWISTISDIANSLTPFIHKIIASANLALKTFKEITTQFFNTIVKFWTSTINQLTNKLKPLLNKLDTITNYVFEKASKACYFTFNYVVETLKLLSDKLINSISSIFQNIAIPFWKNYILPSIVSIKRLTYLAIEKIELMGTKLQNISSEIAKSTFEKSKEFITLIEENITEITKKIIQTQNKFFT